MDDEKQEMARIIEFDEHTDEFGTIFIADQELPFDVKRVLWIKNIRDGRGDKAQKECAQIYVAIQGEMKVEVMNDDWRVFLLNEPTKGLYLPPMTWRKIVDASDDAILMVLNSHHYDPADRLDFDEFLEAVK